MVLFDYFAWISFEDDIKVSSLGYPESGIEASTYARNYNNERVNSSVWTVKIIIFFTFTYQKSHKNIQTGYKTANCHNVFIIQ